MNCPQLQRASLSIDPWIDFCHFSEFQNLWMSKGSGVICYSNVMRLLCHANILQQLKQKYWSSQEKDDSPFQSGWQLEFSSTV